MLHKYDTNPYIEDMTAIEWSNIIDLFCEMEASLYFFSSQDANKNAKSWQALQ
jgi:hypothetical protein